MPQMNVIACIVHEISIGERVDAIRASQERADLWQREYVDKVERYKDQSLPLVTDSSESLDLYMNILRAKRFIKCEQRPMVMT
jgi:hypothetical protein